MSAAEKLRALDLGSGSIDDAEFGMMGYDGLLELRDALPQIMAVVEAAENMGSGEEIKALWAALSALDEQLGDLGSP